MIKSRVDFNNFNTFNNVAENDLKIKDAPLSEEISGSIKMPASDGSGLAKSVSIEQIIESPNSKVAQSEGRITTLNNNVNAEISRATNKESDLASGVTDFANNVTKEAERATKADQETALEIEKVKEMIWSMSAETYSVGFARENGSSDPNAEFTFGTDEMFYKLQEHFRIGVYKNGKLVKQAKKGYLTVAEDGSRIAIDGSMGDVGLHTDTYIYKLCETMIIGGREMNVVALSLQPFSWYDRKAKKIHPFALSLDGTVNAKILDDVRTQAHTVFNRSAAGTYNAPVAIFKGSYKTSGGGYPTHYCSCVESMNQAQNKNELATQNRPYMSGYYEFFEVLVAAILTGCKSTSHTELTRFGCGCTPMDSVNSSTFFDEQMSGNSGWKIILGDSTARYIDLWGNGYVRLTADATAKQSMIGGIAGTSWYGICEIMEAQRLLDGIQRAGLTASIGSKSNLFVMDEEGEVTLISDGSVNVSDGTGMEPLKHYYVVRNVPGFRGLADGIMTAVVNSYTKFEFADGVVINSDNTDMTGCIAIAKRSIPVCCGWALPYHGYFVQSYGAHYICKIDADGHDTYEFRSASDVSVLPAMTSFGYETAVDGVADIERGLDKVLPISYGAANGWAKKSDYSMSLFCHTLAGGGNRTYESAHLWLVNHKPANGKRQVHGSVLGCGAWDSRASCRTALCSRYAGGGYDYYVGSWSIPFLTL